LSFQLQFTENVYLHNLLRQLRIFSHDNTLQHIENIYLGDLLRNLLRNLMR